jgi:hypothetical protein
MTYRAVMPQLFERIVDQTVSCPAQATVGAAGCPPLRQTGG